MTSDFPEIREAVRRVCGQFPGTYWQKLEDAGNYPAEFVAAMTEAGFLSALIPESFGGAGKIQQQKARLQYAINLDFRRSGPLGHDASLLGGLPASVMPADAAGQTGNRLINE